MDHVDITIVIVSMLLLVGIALYCMIDTRERFRSEALLPPESILLLPPTGGDDGTAPTWQEQFLDAVPGVLLIVGLLGTFIGLANSIAAASDALKQGGHTVRDLERQFDALSRAVNGISLKFLSSLVGIVCHLGVRAFFGVLVSPARRDRDEARRRARALASASAANRQQMREETIATGLNGVIDRLGELAALPRALREDLTTLTRLAETNHKALGALDTVAREATTTAQRVRESAEATSEAAKSITAAAESVTVALNTSTMRLAAESAISAERVASSIDTVGQRFVDAGSAFQNALIEHATASLKTTEAAVETTGMLERAASRGVDVAAALNESMQAMQRQGAEWTAAGAQLARLAETHQVTLGALETAAREAATTAQRVKESAEATGEAATSITAAARHVTEAIRASTEATARVGADAAASAERVASSIDTVGQRFVDAGSAFQNALIEHATASLKTTEAAVETTGMLERAASRGVDVAAALNEAMQAMQRQGAKWTDTSERLTRSIDTAAAEISAAWGVAPHSPVPPHAAPDLPPVPQDDARASGVERIERLMVAAPSSVVKS